jgi:PhnB protein
MPSKTEEAAIRAVIEDWANALRSKNAARVMSHGVAGMVQFSLAPPLVADGSGVNDLQTWFETWQGPLGYEFRDLENHGRR